MSFSQAVSGLNAAANNLDVIGNNIANSATFGFKSSTTAFADVFSGSDVGLGVKVSGVIQNFKDGSTTRTDRRLDVAITQGGFFRMEDANGSVFYSRNGQFQMDSERNLINMQGMKLTGYPVVNGEVQVGGELSPLSIPTMMMDAKVTGNAQIKAGLNSMEPAITEVFDATKKETYNFKEPLTVFDSLGNEHVLDVFFVKTADNKWDVHVQDTSVKDAEVQKNVSQLAFTASGQLETVATGTFNMKGLNGSADANIGLDFTGSKQQSIGTNTITAKTQDGYAPGDFTNFRVDNDGKIYGTYSNGRNQVLGQIVLANFANPEGLAAQGDNVWTESGASGSPIVGLAGSGNLGRLVSGALESSNVDMSQELVNMIVAQRNYQSNAQTIKTQDQILQTLVSLR
ncbi:flagellar hook protein FlgE [Xenorhabdus szentirmaii]|uniref:Flagellar hook protein FlgE n=1 Tax=Xenorhabdus szentirmaii DSM 16338 TaxID=1427518 RepID=W1J616_9GAMM|nr:MULTISPECIES: flagellar hook protein FlgE [Xenorhabdus]MBD2792456.1 flagellar hook protein FlgE [Xenorhabdus sp. CUL]MBD2805222.1 flagellar hook protein FlgE [Xenorhabdus sp. ZM]MBD2821548.1 flagellar hook protein FlgE [Xenorhabdus sp. 42]MBD2824925.1 flagellar hook protein FlgE [Xenorhabdus sp. 5]PHM31907.1 flagellar hook protein FlgE [Xenorhabdus szentirmaii DSM 16338]